MNRTKGEKRENNDIVIFFVNCEMFSFMMEFIEIECYVIFGKKEKKCRNTNSMFSENGFPAPKVELKQQKT